MPSTAAAIRAHFRTASPVVAVTLPGTDLILECRRPDLLELTSRGWLNWPTLQRVREITAEWEQERKAKADTTVTVIDNRPTPKVETLMEQARTVIGFLDEWACAAAVTPRVVATEADSSDDSLWVGDLSQIGRAHV